jgi:hypothetical protein
MKKKNDLWFLQGKTKTKKKKEISALNTFM